jgi:hypothetical protein
MRLVLVYVGCFQRGTAKYARKSIAMIVYLVAQYTHCTAALFTLTVPAIRFHGNFTYDRKNNAVCRELVVTKDTNISIMRRRKGKGKGLTRKGQNGGIALLFL